MLHFFGKGNYYLNYAITHTSLAQNDLMYWQMEIYIIEHSMKYDVVKFS